MIFVTVGSQLPFDRLIEAVDKWAGQYPAESVTAQTGHGSYRPQHLEYQTSYTPAEFRNIYEASSFIISHAGIGNILLALELNKPIIIMPRQAALKEHRNDHQLATVKHLQSKQGIFVAEDESHLPAAIDSLLAATAANDSILSPYASLELLTAVREFIAQ